MSTVGFIKRMVSAGFSYEEALIAAEAFEAEVYTMQPAKSAGAIRQARYVERKRHSASLNDANDGSDACEVVPDKEVSPTPPSRKLTLVTPPIVPPVGGDLLEGKTDEKPVAQPDWKILIDRVWQVMSAAARRRTSRADIEAALRSALRRGHDPALIVVGLETYYRSPDATKNDGQFAKGAHRLIQNDRWQAFAETLEPAQSEVQQAEDREAWWGRRVAEYAKSRHWNEVDWGPRPGRSGCRVPSQILESTGILAAKV